MNDDPKLKARLDLLQGEYDRLQTELKTVNFLAPALGAASLVGLFWAWWIPVFGVFIALSIWLATHYIGRTHVLETEERINDTRQHMGLPPIQFQK
jgi:hypothetical protein